MVHQHALVLAFGLLGNIISFLVGLAPLPTFYHIYKKKSAEGFQSIPYVIALLSAMLWIYYALIKKDQPLLITINTFCCLIETIYIAAYLYYAPKKDRLVTIMLILLFNVFGFGVIFLSTYFLRGRVRVVGYICMVFALSVFVAPLCIIRKVIKTKSVEFMPFSLSLFLTLGAIMWFCYGFLLKDMNIAIPNVLGFTFGVLQMLLYVIYKNPKKGPAAEGGGEASKNGSEVAKGNKKLHKLPEQIVVDIVNLSTKMCSSEPTSVAPHLSDDSIEAKLGNGESVKQEMVEHDGDASVN